MFLPTPMVVMHLLEAALITMAAAAGVRCPHADPLPWTTLHRIDASGLERGLAITPSYARHGVNQQATRNCGGWIIASAAGGGVAWGPEAQSVIAGVKTGILARRIITRPRVR